MTTGTMNTPVNTSSITTSMKTIKPSTSAPVESAAGKKSTSIDEMMSKALQGLQLFVSVCAVVGGALLVARPDGSLLKLDLSLAHGTFASWLYPGLLLIGLGFLHATAALLMNRHNRYGTVLSACAGATLFIWIAAQVVFIGFSPLQQLLFASIGFVIFSLAMELVHEGHGPHWLPEDE